MKQPVFFQTERPTPDSGTGPVNASRAVPRPLFGAATRYVRPQLFMGRIIMNAGWHASRWASWSSKSVAGSAKLAAVGSTPMPSRYVASRPIENDAPAACVRGSLKGCIRNCSVSNPFRIACSADCAQTGLRCVFTIRRAGSSARHFGGQGPLRDSALPRDRPYAGKGAALVAGGSDQTDTRLRVPCPFAWRRLGLSRSPSAARLPARVPRATSSGPAGCEGRTRPLRPTAVSPAVRHPGRQACLPYGAGRCASG